MAAGKFCIFLQEYFRKPLENARPFCYNSLIYQEGGNEMKKWITVCLGGVLAASSFLMLASCSDGADPSADRQGKKFSSPDVTYTVSANKEEHAVSDELFGVFLEDINYAGYVLDDNLVANGSFSYRSGTDRWTQQGLAATVEEGEGALHENNPAYARLEIYELDASLVNEGYQMSPMAVEEGVEYTFSAFVKAGSFAGTLMAELRAASSMDWLELGTVQFDVQPSDEWVKYTGTITAAHTADEGVTLRLAFGNTGEVCIDSVALETADSTGGIKNYIYEAIEALSPAFIRFPGGCVIEGRKAGDAYYDWKNSVGVNGADELAPFTYTEVDETGASERVTTYGEPATRKPNTDIWQQSSIDYEMNYAVGFYEYFVLCENVGASALPVLNAGLSCMIQDGGGHDLNGRYGNGLQDFIDEALDVVAFAKGDPASSDPNEAKWAQARVNMGHPEPFEMHYLGIGNEQWDTKYYSKYRDFVEAFREAKAENPALYGDIELVVGNGAAFGDCENAKTGAQGLARSNAIQYRLAGKIENLSEFGIHDHHYYMNYIDFLANTDLYDSYTREGADYYGVFVGEYSANQANNLQGYPNPQVNNSWITALSEAAYMTGLERNGDVVRLAAYAPMFGCVNAGYNQWAADMMFYTNTELVLTPNYYVQQLFMRNTGDSVLTTKEKLSSDFVNTATFGSTEVPALYKVISRDAETGDILVKLVNAGERDINVNIAVKGASTAGIAHVSTLQCDDINAVNSLTAEAVSPENYTLGIASTFGYTAEGRSVTVIRITTK